MKFETTKKAMRAGYNNIITISYCRAESLLRNHEPVAYSAGEDGWSCDYYDINGTLICTGYRPISGIRPSYDKVKEYDDKAYNIIANYDLDYEERKKQVEELLQSFINDCVKGGQS